MPTHPGVLIAPRLPSRPDIHVNMSSSAPPKASGWSALLIGAALSVSGLACDANPSAPSANTASGSLDGELSAVSVLGSTGGASTLYFLRIAGRPAPLPLTFDADPELPSNSSVRVWGAPDGSAFHVSRITVIDDPGAGSDTVTRSALIGQPSTSPTVAWVQMDVNSGGVTQTVAQAQQLIFGTGTGPLCGPKAGQMSVVQYYAENSYGMMQLTGQVEGPIPFSGTACNNFDPLAQNVVAQITAMGRTYDHYYLYWGSEQPCGPGWGDQGTRAKPGKYVWLNNDGTFCTATGQELGHNFGMMHASTMDCPSATIANDTTTCTSNEYGNPMTVMGGGCGHLNAVEKWYDGFLLGCNAIKVGASGTFTLLPIEIPLQRDPGAADRHAVDRAHPHHHDRSIRRSCNDRVLLPRAARRNVDGHRHEDGCVRPRRCRHPGAQEQRRADVPAGHEPVDHGVRSDVVGADLHRSGRRGELHAPFGHCQPGERHGHHRWWRWCHRQQRV